MVSKISKESIKQVIEKVGTVGYGRMNIIGSGTLFVIASVRSSIH